MAGLRVATVLACSLLTAQLLTAEPLRLVGDDFCPYNCETSTDNPGYLVEVLEAIFAAQGIGVTYQLKPWSRAVHMVSKGEAHILLANTYQSAPDPQLQLVMGEDSTCFLARSNFAWQYSTHTDLHQQRLGVIQGYHYDSNGPLDQYLNSNPALVYRAKGELPLRNLMAMLLEERIDLVLDNCNVLKRKVSKLGIAHLTRVAGVLPGYRANLHIAFSPADPLAPERLELVRSGLNELRRNGRLAQILQRYAVDDWQTPTPESVSTAQTN